MTDFRARVRRRETVIGPILTVPSPAIAEVFAQAGCDWIWIDLEHAPTSLDQAGQMIRAVGGRAATVIRVPWNDAVHIKQALDLGCDGVVVPQVRSADEARQAVASAKYPPAGVRSVGIARAQAYGMSLADYVRTANEEIAVLVQIEHIDALPHLADILAVPGVDAVIVGPYDLSASLGRPGEVGHPDVVAAVDAVAAACRERQVAWGAFAADAAGIQPHQARGATVLAVGMDTIYLWKGARAVLAELRS
jgi:2-dehydro-3-deoxyglucarate aldolase/4-hydroxy-2-oxoheptanedioate aldolase